MKLSKILLILFVSVSVLSCKKDDDGESKFVLSNENVAGEHDLVFFKSTIVETTNVNGLDVVSTITSTGDTFDVEFDFNANGTYTASGLYRIVSKTVVNGETTDEDAYIETIDISNGTFSATSSSSVMILDGEAYEVTLFDRDELRIKYEDLITQQNGDTEMTTIEARFVRQ